MSSQPIHSSVSPLRRRMLEDMAMRGLREETQRDYMRFVRSFAAFLGRPPETATAEDIRRFQVHQGRERCATADHQLLGVGAALLLHRDTSTGRTCRASRPGPSPPQAAAVLSVEEVGRLLAAAPGLKYGSHSGPAYGARPAWSEVAALEGRDIDSERMLLRVEQGKGRKNRNAMLSAATARAAAALVARGQATERHGCPTAGCFRGGALSSPSRPAKPTALS